MRLATARDRRLAKRGLFVVSCPGNVAEVVQERLRPMVMEMSGRVSANVAPLEIMKLVAMNAYMQGFADRENAE